jgi:hypothetical protein
MEQDYAQYEGECVFDDIGVEKAAALADLIRQQPVKPKRAWGEPVVEGGKVRAMLRYGPVLGAWPKDLQRIALKLMAQVKAGGSVEVKDDPGRTVIMARAEYDKRSATDAPKPAPLPPEYEDDDTWATDVRLSAEQAAVYESMSAPEVARFGEPLLVRVGDEVHAIYPDGSVQGPKDGKPRDRFATAMD